MLKEVRSTMLAATVVLTFVSTNTAQSENCTVEERRDALRAMQAQVLAVAPQRLDLLEKAIQAGGPLAQWIMSHGHVVFAHSGAVPVGNARAKDPLPQLLRLNQLLAELGEPPLAEQDYRPARAA
jgi:hypothetical protein